MHDLISISILMLAIFLFLRTLPLVILIPVGILILSFMFPQDKGLRIVSGLILNHLGLFILLGIGAFLLRKIFK